MDNGSDFDFGPRKFFVFKMHGPAQGGQNSKCMKEIGVQTRFFATRSPAYFKGLMNLNKLTT